MEVGHMQIAPGGPQRTRVQLLVAEPTALRALELADHAYVMELGRVVIEGAHVVVPHHQPGPGPGQAAKGGRGVVGGGDLVGHIFAHHERGTTDAVASE